MDLRNNWEAKSIRLNDGLNIGNEGREWFLIRFLIWEQLGRCFCHSLRQDSLEAKQAKGEDHNCDFGHCDFEVAATYCLES